MVNFMSSGPNQGAPLGRVRLGEYSVVRLSACAGWLRNRTQERALSARQRPGIHLPSPKRMTTRISRCSPVVTRGRERVPRARRPQLPRTRRLLKPAALPHRSLDLTRQLLWHEAVYPRRHLRRILTLRRARIRDREQRDRIGAVMTATVVPSAAN